MEPSAEQSSVMRTGLGAVALYTPLKDGVVSAARYRFTRSSLACQHGLPLRVRVMGFTARCAAARLHRVQDALR